MDELKIGEEEETEEIQSEEHQLKAARLQIEDKIKSGANWFFLIGILSVINSLYVLFTKAETGFIIASGITRVIRNIVLQTGSDTIATALVLEILVALLFILIGFLARNKHKWAFMAGVSIYILDALILLRALDIFSIAFHIIILLFIFKGIRALKVFERIERKGYITPGRM